jgi:hypothetical protein
MFNLSLKLSPTTKESSLQPESFIKFIPATFNRIYDPQFGQSFVSDDIECNPQLNSHRGYRQADFKFMKFLISAGILALKEGCYVCLGFKKKGERDLPTHKLFYRVIDGLELAYITDEYIDLDLDDEIYDHGSIVRPCDLYTVHVNQRTGKKSKRLNEELMESHRLRWGLQFKSEEDRNNYYISRSKLYCQYVFLRRIAILYRDTPFKEPLEKFEEFYTRAGKDTLNLRVEAVTYLGDNWSSGLHEWLMCASFKEALDRTSGKAAGRGIMSCLPAVQASVSLRGENGKYAFCYWSEFNWLDYQFLIRSKYTNLIYRNNLEGHTGSINQSMVPLSRSVGWFSTFRPAPNELSFDRKLMTLLQQASTPYELIKETYKFYYSNMLHDQTERYGEHIARFGHTIKGKCTQTNIEEIKTELKETHDEFKIWLRDLWLQSQLIPLNHQEWVVFHYQEEKVLPLELEVELRGENPITISRIGIRP